MIGGIMVQAWVLRSLRIDQYEELAFNRDLVAVGWAEVGDMGSLSGRAQIRDAVRAAFPFVGRDSIDSYTDQLIKFRDAVSSGDIVVLLRYSSPDIAIGHIAGAYQYRHDLYSGVRHVHSVRWVRTNLPRTSVEDLLTDMSPLDMIFRISLESSVERLKNLIQTDNSLPETKELPNERRATKSYTPFENLQRNLNYARSLATAGHHLAELQVGAFEVSDVYRAAWVQSVAALDYWVRQEIRLRMLRLAQRPAEQKPRGFSEFTVSLANIEDLLQSRTSLAEVIDDQLSRTRGHIAYQHPQRIREAFSLVSDISDLWGKVAKVLSERAGEGRPIRGGDVQEQLAAIVQRRNKIAHEYDEDPDRRPAKRPIDSAMVTQTVDWIEQLAAAILLVLEST